MYILCFLGTPVSTVGIFLEDVRILGTARSCQVTPVYVSTDGELYVCLVMGTICVLPEGEPYECPLKRNYMCAK